MKKIVKKIIQLFMKNRVLSEIVVRFIIKKYTKINYLSKSGKHVKTPWVCDFKYNINTWINYIDEVYDDYLIHSNLNEANLEGMKVLEIGPGENLGLALKLIANGVSKVVCVDKFNSLTDGNSQRKIYNHIINNLTEKQKTLSEQALKISNDDCIFNADHIEYNNCSVVDLVKKYENTFDLVISRAVLEHIHNIGDVLEATNKLLTNGGLAIHEVDFRDHGMFTMYGLHELAMYKIDDLTWEKMSSNIGAPNRKTVNYYINFYKNNSYDVNVNVVRTFNKPEIKINISLEEFLKSNLSIDPWIIENLGENFHQKNKEDYQIASAAIIAKKILNN